MPFVIGVASRSISTAEGTVEMTLYDIQVPTTTVSFLDCFISLSAKARSVPSYDDPAVHTREGRHLSSGSMSKTVTIFR